MGKSLIWFEMELERQLLRRMGEDESRAVLEEIRFHIHAETDAEVELGANMEEAERAVVHRFGNPLDLAKRLAYANLRINKGASCAAAWLTGLAVLLVGLSPMVQIWLWDWTIIAGWIAAGCTILLALLSFRGRLFRPLWMAGTVLVATVTLIGFYTTTWLDVRDESGNGWVIRWEVPKAKREAQESIEMRKRLVSELVPRVDAFRSGLQGRYNPAFLPETNSYEMPGSWSVDNYGLSSPQGILSEAEYRVAESIWKKDGSRFLVQHRSEIERLKRFENAMDAALTRGPVQGLDSFGRDIGAFGGLSWLVLALVHWLFVKLGSVRLRRRRTSTG